jgi:hypothetical protein
LQHHWATRWAFFSINITPHRAKLAVQGGPVAPRPLLLSPARPSPVGKALAWFLLAATWRLLQLACRETTTNPEPSPNGSTYVRISAIVIDNCAGRTGLRLRLRSAEMAAEMTE